MNPEQFTTTLVQMVLGVAMGGVIIVGFRVLSLGLKWLWKALQRDWGKFEIGTGTGKKVVSSSVGRGSEEFNRWEVKGEVG
jgi:hypothetical protein